VVLLISQTCFDRHMAVIGKPHLATIVDNIQVGQIAWNVRRVVAILPSVTRIDSEVFG
jgi:hypothetical protein